MKNYPVITKIKEILKAANIEISPESEAQDLWWVTLKEDPSFLIYHDKDFGIRIYRERHNPEMYVGLKEENIDNIPAIIDTFRKLESLVK